MKRILILRLSAWMTIKHAIHYASKYYPGCAIDVFMQKDVRPPFDVQGVSFFAGKGNSLSFFEIKKFIKAKGGYDAVILPYNNTCGDGYLKRELTFLMLPVEDKHVINVYGHGYKLSAFGILFRRFKRYVSFALSTKIMTQILLFLTSGIIRMIYLFGTKKDKSDVVFISHFGYALPSARIRCYNFSGVLNSAGISSVVLSMEDHFGVIYDETLLPEKLWANIKLAVRLLGYSKSVLVVLKPNYHYLAPYLMNKSIGNNLVFDYDDLDVGSEVFKGVKAIDIFDKLTAVSCTNIAASKTLAEYFEEKGKSSVFIPTGPDTKKFIPFGSEKFHKTSGTVVCGWVGMVWSKAIADNLKYLFESIAELCDSRIYVHLAVGGVAVEYVRRYAEEILPDKVFIHYMLSPEMVVDFINFTDVGCFPFVDHSTYNRAKSPNQLFEYMACAKPTVSTPVGEIPKFIKHQKNGFLAKDKETFKMYLSLLADNAELRRTMGAEAIQTIKESYCLKVCGNKFARTVRPFINF